MITPSGLVEVNSGWSFAVAAVAPGQLRLVLQYDPDRQFSCAGITEIRLDQREAEELETALARARHRATRGA